jgi:hypothetical protein
VRHMSPSSNVMQYGQLSVPAMHFYFITKIKSNHIQGKPRVELNW